MPALATLPLSEASWPAFARLVEANNGVWGGCWCLAFHRKPLGSAEANREAKLDLVRAGRAHAALVMRGDACLGWCQFGPTATLPRIKNRKVYDQGLTALPDWRITCFFVGKTHRGAGVAATALAGALEQIIAAGGGTVEAYPEDTANKKTSSSFLWNGTLAMFEAQGFTRTRLIGKDKWVVTKRL